MDPTFYAFLVLVFAAVVLAFEGMYHWWQNQHGVAAKRIQSRIQALSAGGQVNKERLTILKDRMLNDSKPLDRMFMQLPRVKKLDLLIQQSGMKCPVTRLIGISAALPPVALAVSTFLPVHVLYVVPAALLTSALPWLYVKRRVTKRLRQLERQLPDAADMISRALRAGHAFSGAIGMVSAEFAEPMGGEFRITFDEINYGVPIGDALMNLATRVPIDDLRYFVIAVLIQRESGGNLAEVLDNISTLIRERLKLFDKVRVLSAEGKLSAWVLGLLPFVTCGFMMLINPTFLEVLWTDPAGLKLVETVLVSMVFGVLWMRKIIRIRV
ncbi:type II secretion system F family protein [Trinickia sp. YCB016]